MNWKPIKSFLASTLAFGLTTQSISSYGLIVSVPSKPVSVKYPEHYQKQIEEVAVCILEAEAEIYDENILSTLPPLKISETRTCHEILKTKSYATNLLFEVDFSKSHGEIETPGGLIIPQSFPQERLTILDKPLELKGNNYLKDTETLEIAMRLFQDLNIELYGDLGASHQENDLLDVLYLRIFNLVYELPKVQGHPLMLEFMKDIRDNFFRVNCSQFFKALVWHAYQYNPDKEISRTLNLYRHQIQYAGIDPGSQIPDENLVLPGEETIIDTTPPLGDFSDIAQEDFDRFWGDVYEEVIEEENKEDLGDSYAPSVPSDFISTMDLYEVKNGVCFKTTITNKNGVEVSRKTEEASKNELYRCGDASLLGNAPTPQEDPLDSLNPLLSYRYGGESSEWVHTELKAKEGALSYNYLSDLLMTIATEEGSGALQEDQRWLYILSEKPLYLEKYKDPWMVSEINSWLQQHEIQLEFGLSVQEQQAQEEFFEWLEQSKE